MYDRGVKDAERVVVVAEAVDHPDQSARRGPKLAEDVGGRVKEAELARKIPDLKAQQRAACG